MLLDLCIVEDGPVWIKVIAVEAVSSTAKMCMNLHKNESIDFLN